MVDIGDKVLVKRFGKDHPGRVFDCYGRVRRINAQRIITIMYGVELDNGEVVRVPAHSVVEVAQWLASH